MSVRITVIPVQLLQLLSTAAISSMLTIHFFRYM